MVVAQVGGRAVAERRRQSFVDGGFEREDHRGALARFLRIESLKACDTLLQPLDATPLLSNCQDWRFWLGRRGRTTGHAKLFVGVQESYRFDGAKLPIRMDAASM